MKKSITFITLSILITSLTSCIFSAQPNSEIVQATSNNLVPSSVVVTPQPTFTQTAPPLAINPTTTPGIPSIIKQVYLNTPIVDVLIDPDSDRLYVVDEQGELKVLGLADNKEIARLQTAFQVVDGYVYSSNSYSGKVLSLDPSRNRLYVSGNSIFIIDTVSLTTIERLNLSGQFTSDPTRNRAYFTLSNGDGVDCGTRILNVETWEEIGILYPTGTKEPPPIMGPCISSTRLDVENQILYATGRVCSGGSSCGSLTVSTFDVSGSPTYIANVGETMTFDPVHKRIFTSAKIDYREHRLSRFEIQGQILTRTLHLPQPGYWGKMLYDPVYDRLYGGNGNSVSDSIFDGDLSLIVEFDFPGSLLNIDQKNQRLYAGDEKGNLVVISTGFGPK